MTISDADFSAWLRSGALRCLLVEASYRDLATGALGTEYMATGPYVTAPDDEPANTAYAAIVVAVPELTQEMSDVLTGGTQRNPGRVEVSAGDAATDSWLLGRDWCGYACGIYVGDPTWPRADFRPVWIGVIADVGLSSTRRMLFGLRDRQHLLNQATRVSMVSAGIAKEQAAPLCYGDCNRVQPIQIDATTYTYQYHDGPVRSAAAYVGVVFLGGYPNVIHNHATGTFRVPGGLAGYAGYLTVLVQGAVKDGAYTVDSATGETLYQANTGTYLETAGQIARDLLTTRGGFSDTDLDLDSFAALDVVAPAPVCLAVEAGESKPYELLDQVLGTVGAMWGVRRDGRFFVRQVSFDGAPVRTIDADDVVQDGLRLVAVYQPVDRVRMRYAINWHPEQYGPATDNLYLSLLASRGRVAVADNPASYVKTRSLDVIESLFPGTLSWLPDPPGNPDADAEAARRIGLWGKPRYRFALEAFDDSMRLDLGDVVTLRHSRYGMSDGVPGVIVKINERMSRRRVSLEVLV